MFQNKIRPTKDTILRLRPHIQQIEAVHISWYACLLSVISKHTYSSTLGELSIFIIQILY